MMLSIRSVPKSFRRCGRGFTAAPQVFEADAFTDAELATLRAETMLVVSEVPAEVAAEKAAAEIKVESQVKAAADAKKAAEKKAAPAK